MQQVPSRPTLPEDTLIYLGRSMNPTFTDLDLLAYDSPGGPVHPGDVIAFRRPHGDRVIVHRVVSTDGTAMRTQGDGNVLPDPFVVERSSVIGVIRSRQRNRTTVPVHGGRRGLARFRYLGERQRAIRLCVRLTAPWYRLLVRHRLISRFSTGFVSWEIRTDTRTGGDRLWCFGRLAGVRSPDSPRWRLVAPFPVVIDERYLPVPGPGPRLPADEG